MSVLRVVSLLDASGITGPAKNLIQLCQGVNANYPGEFPARISIATICRGGVTTNAFIETARAAGIEVDVMQERYRYDPQVFGQLRDVIQRRGAGLIETHGVRMHFVARFSGVAAKVPWVAFHHGYTAEDLKMRAYNQLDRWSLRGAARIFADCQPFADELAGFGIRRDRLRALGSSIAIREPATREEAGALREQLGITQDEPVVLTIGRLSGEKAQADLIAAAAHLHRSKPDRKFRLVLVGDGPERDRLREAANAAGLSNIVIFAGQQKDVRPYYATAQVFVLPSLSEGSPNVLLEAMAAGVPIISTAVGGVPEMVEHEKSALLVPPRQPEALAKEIERLLADPALGSRLAKEAGMIVREKFSPDVYRSVVLEAYLELSRGKQ
jgi:glycosyltransferase involved in cell wall biosynthesis